MKNKGHRGNVKAQRKRKRQRDKNRPKKQNLQYELIDGNMTFYPRAYCDYHQGWMTDGLINTHRCRQRKCKMLKEGLLDEKRKKNIPS